MDKLALYPLSHFMSPRQQANVAELELLLVTIYGGYTKVLGSYYVLAKPRKDLPTAFSSSVIVGLEYNKHGQPLPPTTIDDVHRDLNRESIRHSNVYETTGAWVNDDGVTVTERGALISLRTPNYPETIHSGMTFTKAATKIRDLYNQSSVVLNMGYNGSVFV